MWGSISTNSRMLNRNIDVLKYSEPSKKGKRNAADQTQARRSALVFNVHILKYFNLTEGQNPPSEARALGF